MQWFAEVLAWFDALWQSLPALLRMSTLVVSVMMSVIVAVALLTATGHFDHRGLGGFPNPRCRAKWA
jgi:hypothetical protein